MPRTDFYRVLVAVVSTCNQVISCLQIKRKKKNRFDLAEKRNYGKVIFDIEIDKFLKIRFGSKFI